MSRTTEIANGRSHAVTITAAVLVNSMNIAALGRTAQLCIQTGGACTTTYATADELRAFGAMAYAMAAELESAAMVALANANEVTT